MLFLSFVFFVLFPSLSFSLVVSLSLLFCLSFVLSFLLLFFDGLARQAGF